MSVTIIFWALSSYTLQSIIVTTAIFIPVYLFIACLSRDRMSGLTSCQIRLRNEPNFNRLYLRQFWADLLVVFSIIICSSKATKLSTTGSVRHFRRFHLEIPNFKYKICPVSKYNLHFLHNRLKFGNQIFTQNFYIVLTAVCKARKNEIDRMKIRGAVKKFWAWLLSGILLGGKTLLPLAMASC